MNDAIRGLIAGAAGTVALNLTTYLDMALRGRPASTVPADLAGRLGKVVGVEPLVGSDGDGEQAGNRRTGTGALLGYLNGLGIGAAYGALNAAGTDRNATGAALPLAGVGLGLAAMAASDIPATAAGVADPREWGPAAWLADIVPHLAYGMVTVGTYHVLGRRAGDGGLLGRLAGR